MLKIILNTVREDLKMNKEISQEKLEEFSLFSLLQKEKCSVLLSLQCDMGYSCSFFQASGYIRSYIHGQ